MKVRFSSQNNNSDNQLTEGEGRTVLTTLPVLFH